MEARSFTVSVIAFYLVLGFAAWGWVALRGLPWTRLVVPGAPSGLALEVGVGVGFGLLVVWIGGVLERRIGALRRLAQRLQEMLPHLSDRDIVVAAIASSVSEELFFRGAMQGALGFWVTAAVFAVAHGGLVPGLRAWVVFAGVMGLVFGGMVLWLGTLTAPICAHAVINGLNLRSMERSRSGAAT